MSQIFSHWIVSELFRYRVIVPCCDVTSMIIFLCVCVWSEVLYAGRSGQCSSKVQNVVVAFSRVSNFLRLRLKLGYGPCLLLSEIQVRLFCPVDLSTYCTVQKKVPSEKKSVICHSSWQVRLYRRWKVSRSLEVRFVRVSDVMIWLWLWLQWQHDVIRCRCL